MENSNLIRVPSKFIYTPWQDIIAKSGEWFSKSNFRWWQTRVSWSSLTPIAAGNFLFITSDTDLNGGRVYSVREWNPDGKIHTQAAMLADRRAAVRVAKALLLEEQKYSGIKQAQFGHWYDR